MAQKMALNVTLHKRSETLLCGNVILGFLNSSQSIKKMYYYMYVHTEENADIVDHKIIGHV